MPVAQIPDLFTFNIHFRDGEGEEISQNDYNILRKKKIRPIFFVGFDNKNGEGKREMNHDKKAHFIGKLLVGGGFSF